ncbi:hypothetical protein ACP70R_048775 [Stipagrostis hirtigluma subsp. patula]
MYGPVLVGPVMGQLQTTVTRRIRPEDCSTMRSRKPSRIYLGVDLFGPIKLRRPAAPPSSTPLRLSAGRASTVNHGGGDADRRPPPRKQSRRKTGSACSPTTFYILDKLDVMHEAVRTSVLSRRWRHLTGLHSRIVVDVLYFQPDDQDSELTLDDLVRGNNKAIQAAKSILAHRSQATITFLYLRFYLTEESVDIFTAVDEALAYREITGVELVVKTELPEARVLSWPHAHVWEAFHEILSSMPSCLWCP